MSYIDILNNIEMSLKSLQVMLSGTWMYGVSWLIIHPNMFLNNSLKNTNLMKKSNFFSKVIKKTSPGNHR